ncbi:hypothetical protein J6S88_00525 [bacterium]|nr:hypothetical protein [bacterium]
MSINIINDLMGKLGMGNKEKTYVSVSQSGILEVCQYDELTGKLSKYASSVIPYDINTKEIADLEKFRDTYLELLTELDIKANSDVILNVPTVLMGSRELPSMLDDTAIGQSVLSEIENSYIFSRYLPLFDWDSFEAGENVGMRDVFYSALQDEVIAKIKDLFKSFGAKIIGIETSYTSILNGLARTNLIRNQLMPESTWNFLIINSDGYALFSMTANKILDYVQEDFSVEAESSDTVYNSLAQAVELALLGFTADSLVVVSECDLINAEELCSSLMATGSLEYKEVIYIDDNIFRKEEFVPISAEVDQKYKLKPSLKLLGMLDINTMPSILHFDFIKSNVKQNTDNEVVTFAIGKNIYEITPNTAKTYSIILLIAVVVILGLMALIFTITDSSLNSKIKKIETEIQQLQGEIDELSKIASAQDAFNAKQEIKNVLNNNRIKLIAYRTIGEVIPRRVWMTYFKTYNDGKIIIEGVSGNIDDINKFHRNIINVLPDSGLKLKNATMEDDGNVDAAVAQSHYYDFIITNDDAYPPPPPAPDKK